MPLYPDQEITRYIRFIAYSEKSLAYGVWLGQCTESGNAGYIDCRTSTTRYEDWRAVNKGMPTLDIRDLRNVKESTVPKVLTTDNGGSAFYFTVPLLNTVSREKMQGKFNPAYP